MSGPTTRVRRLAPWHPQLSTRALLDIIEEVLVEYRDYVPLTVRQMFYRLVGTHGYDKTDKAYARLGEHLNRARRAGIIPFGSIRDDETTLAEPTAWTDVGEMVQAFIASAENFRLDRQQGQRRRLIFAVEASGMLPQVQRIVDPFGIAVHSSGGFDSVTAKYDLAASLGHWSRVEVLHVGDHDPSGVHLFSSMSEDVCAFARDLDLPARILFSRLAVTPEQIAALALPTAPAKPTDRRAFTGETVQCEAIPPDVLARIISDAIDQRLDRDAFDQRLDRDAFDQVLNAERRTQANLPPRLATLLTDTGGGA